MHINILKIWAVHMCNTGPIGAVTMLLANGLVGTVFASRYWLQPRVGRCKATTLSSLSPTSNRVTTNY